MTGQAGRAVWFLALGQLLTYAGVYYSFAALLPDLLAATGWSKGQLAAGPTLAFLVAGLVTPLTGRLVDRGYAGLLLLGMPVLAGLALMGLSFAGSPLIWLALWGVIGVAQAGMMYETCFAHLTRHTGADARTAITRVTLVAGLAGTLSFPLGHWLGAALGGQQAFLVFGAVLILGAAPINLLGLRGLKTASQDMPSRAGDGGSTLSLAMRRPAFWVIAGLFGLVMLNHSLILTFVLILMGDKGASPATAALAAACIGPAQVLGRIVLMVNAARMTNGRATIIALAMVALASLVLGGSGAWIGLIFVFAVLQGAGVGILSILRPVLAVEHLGRTGFGAISGAIAVAPTLAQALGPSLGAWLIAWRGEAAALIGATVMAFVAMGLGAWLARWPRTEE